MEFKTIETYDNAADLIREHFQEDVSDEILFHLDHVNDFDAVNFLVINGSDVVIVDTINGCVYGHQPLDEFIQMAIEEAMEEISDEI